VVCIPATSDVLDATSAHLCTSFLDCFSLGSSLLCNVHAVLGDDRAPNLFSISRSGAPYGPSVIFTAVARMLTPRKSPDVNSRRYNLFWPVNFTLPVMSNFSLGGGGGGVGAAGREFSAGSGESNSMPDSRFWRSLRMTSTMLFSAPSRRIQVLLVVDLMSLARVLAKQDPGHSTFSTSSGMRMPFSILPLDGPYFAHHVRFFLSQYRG